MSSFASRTSKAGWPTGFVTTTCTVRGARAGGGDVERERVGPSGCCSANGVGAGLGVRAGRQPGERPRSARSRPPAARPRRARRAGSRPRAAAEQRDPERRRDHQHLEGQHLSVAGVDELRDRVELAQPGDRAGDHETATAPIASRVKRRRRRAGTAGGAPGRGARGRRRARRPAGAGRRPDAGGEHVQAVQQLGRQASRGRRVPREARQERPGASAPSAAAARAVVGRRAASTHEQRAIGASTSRAGRPRRSGCRGRRRASRPSARPGPGWRSGRRRAARPPAARATRVATRWNAPAAGSSAGPRRSRPSAPAGSQTASRKAAMPIATSRPANWKARPMPATTWPSGRLVDQGPP